MNHGYVENRIYVKRIANAFRISIISFCKQQFKLNIKYIYLFIAIYAHNRKLYFMFVMIC